MDKNNLQTTNLDYASEYGTDDDGTGNGLLELQPTMLPTECNLSGAGIAIQNTIDNVHLLFQHRIILWPNFTNCLPNCGLCTQFASDQFYITYNLVVIGLLLPFISLCGLCGNVLSAFVYSRISLRHSYSGSLYLSALGCSDALVIITALFLFFVDSIRRYSLALSIVYGTLSPIVYPAGMIAQTCSVYFTLVAGIDCFVQVWLPTMSKGLFSRQCFQKTTIGAVLLFALLYNIPYTLVYYKYMYALFLAVGPLAILIALNTAVIVGTMLCKRGNSEDNMALILVVLLFILCNTIALLINIFETHLSTALSWRINYIIDISNLLVVFNSSLNFIIYYTFSGPFRATFCYHFGTKKGGGGGACRRRSQPSSSSALTSTSIGGTTTNTAAAAGGCDGLAVPAPQLQTTTTTITKQRRHHGGHQMPTPAGGGGRTTQNNGGTTTTLMMVSARKHRSPLIGLGKSSVPLLSTRPGEKEEDEKYWRSNIDNSRPRQRLSNAMTEEADEKEQAEMEMGTEEKDRTKMSACRRNNFGTSRREKEEEEEGHRLAGTATSFTAAAAVADHHQQQQNNQQLQMQNGGPRSSTKMEQREEER